VVYTGCAETSTHLYTTLERENMTENATRAAVYARVSSHRTQRFPSKIPKCSVVFSDPETSNSSKRSPHMSRGVSASWPGRSTVTHRKYSTISTNWSTTGTSNYLKRVGPRGLSSNTTRSASICRSASPLRMLHPLEPQKYD